MRLVRCVAGMTAALAVGLAGCGTGRHVAGNPAGRAPTARSTAARSASSPPTTSPAPVAVPPYAVASMSITATVRANDGATVEIPTTVWYPSGPGVARMPLVVFSPGYQIDPGRYDPLTLAWAAAGFVVAEPDYPDTALGSPPIEGDIVNHPGELRQVITTLISGGPAAGLIERDEIAVVGHSDGGDVSLAAAYNTCCRDPRIGAAIILSGAEWTIFGGGYYATGGPPMLVVQGDEDTINDPACSAELFDSAPQPRYYFDIPDGTHLSPYTAPVGPEVTAVREVTISFLEGYLKGMTTKVAELRDPEGAVGVGRMIEGPAAVPVRGTCPGAPVPGGL